MFYVKFRKLNVLEMKYALIFKIIDIERRTIKNGSVPKSFILIKS
jgi:hypothetical protein